MIRPSVRALLTGLLTGLLAGVLATAATAATAEDATPTESPPPSRYQYGFELKAHYRSSEDSRFLSPFPFPPEVLPPGQTRGFEETVDAGHHFEVSTVTLWAEADWSDLVAGRLKIDFIDLYDRNPTSDDKQIDVDEAWLRYGREAEPAAVPEKPSFYLKLGKFGKFERQDDRHLESYGIVGTTFSRAEDVGLELGVDLGRHFYAKGSFSNGNPVFIRDPNALAGDNGTRGLNFLLPGFKPHPVPKLKTGVVVPYDADVDTLDFSHPQIGLGLGGRFESASGFAALDVLVWGRERTLAREAAIHGSFYGGDLDLLRGPADAFSLPVAGDRKREVGVNLWLYLGKLSLFGQYVDQDLAGLGRSGIEAELAYAFDLPLKWAAKGRQIFPWIAPVIRFSELDPRFGLAPGNGAFYPAPSVTWDWRKVDLGVRLAVIEGVDVTAEYADNSFVRKGRRESNDEFLLTVMVALDRER